ncbi:hypothetical protein BURKHO8Y_140112 [Burkholderia sp. 8Y]|nr:hypothetical protein BURKHO8Y_140112 [Burkholderia sp. 8Y]
MRFGTGLGKRRAERRTHVAAAGACLLDGTRHQLDGFGFVDEAHCARIQNGAENGDIADAGQHDNANTRPVLLHFADQAESVLRFVPRLGHGKIGHEHVARRFSKLSEQSARIPCFACHAQTVVCIEERLHSKDYERMVVGQHYTKHHYASGYIVFMKGASQRVWHRGAVIAREYAQRRARNSRARAEAVIRLRVVAGLRLSKLDDNTQSVLSQYFKIVSIKIRCALF